MDHADVLVIGGGPAGAAAALTLARHAPHLHVMLAEAQPAGAIGERPMRSGEVLFAGHRRELARLDVPVAGAPWALHDVTRFRVVAPDAREYRAEVPWARRLVEVSRDAFDVALRDAAAAAGVDVRHEWKAVDAAFSHGAVQEVAFQTPEGTARVTARWVVDAGGRFALIPRKLGLKAQPKEDNHAVVTGFYRDFPQDRDEWEIHFLRDFPVTAEISSPVPGLTRIGCGTPMSTLRASRLNAAEFLAHALGHDAEIRARLEASAGLAYTWNVAPVAYRVRQPALANALLAGDARGYLSPFFGDGTLIALRSGREAAERILAAERGGTNAAEAHRRALRRLDRVDRVRAQALRVFEYDRVVSAGFRSGAWKWFLHRQLA